MARGVVVHSSSGHSSRTHHEPHDVPLGADVHHHGHADTVGSKRHRHLDLGHHGDEDAAGGLHSHDGQEDHVHEARGEVEAKAAEVEVRREEGPGESCDADVVFRN